MDLEVRKDVAFNTTYSRWVKDDIDAFERQMSKARIKKDGYFYKNDYARLVAWAGYAFNSIAHFLYSPMKCVMNKVRFCVRLNRSLLNNLRFLLHLFLNRIKI